MLRAQVVGERVGGEAKAADPGFGVFVFGGEGGDAGSALGAKEGVGFEGLGFGEEGGVEIAERHD